MAAANYPRPPSSTASLLLFFILSVLLAFAWAGLFLLALFLLLGFFLAFWLILLLGFLGLPVGFVIFLGRLGSFARLSTSSRLAVLAIFIRALILHKLFLESWEILQQKLFCVVDLGLNIKRAALLWIILLENSQVALELADPHHTRTESHFFFFQ